ncbi:MAG: D-2-hydroxyacid dehydrogenase [Clostridiales bacterium]|nr:D-2-hydroxyacid dehydrogenase [Clostridiales bacterium]
MNITVLDGYAANPGDIPWDEVSRLGTLSVYDRSSPEEIVPRAKDCEILLTNKCVISREVMNALPRLRYIGVLATGYNNIDLDAARERGIAVTNIPAYSTSCVSQLVMALILEAALHVGEHSRLCLEGAWQASPDFCFWKYPLTELEGKTLGIIGQGRIGSRVQALAEAFGMNTIAYSPSRCDKSVLDRIFSESDIISLNCPLKPETRGLICAKSIQRMKKGVWIVNTARGPVVDETNMAEALKSGRVGMYMADVVSTEPIEGTNPLLSAPNVILTPHIGWATLEARKRLMTISARNIAAFLNGEKLNRVE